MARRELHLLFQEPGMVEAIAVDPTCQRTGKSIHSRGYGDTSILDLMADYRDGEDRPFAWIAYNLHKTYPAVIWGLRLLLAGERFDVHRPGCATCHCTRRSVGPTRTLSWKMRLRIKPCPPPPPTSAPA